MGVRTVAKLAQLLDRDAVQSKLSGMGESASEGAKMTGFAVGTMDV